MKKLYIVLIFSLISLGVFANAAPDSLLGKANKQYIEGDFDKAAELYQTLVDSGYHNAELYYNLGNSYFKLNRIAYAVLNYERAYLLKPYDEDIEFNLEYARTFIVDRIEPLPVFFLVKWYRSARGMFSSNGWALTSILFFALTLALVLTFWFSYKPWIKRLTFALAILMFTLFVFSAIFSAQEKKRVSLRDQAIIFQSAVTVKSSPGEAGKDIFILHSGTKVKITKAIGTWVEIRVADGNKGWISSEAVELI
jgi:tetratricopeptide (TPR) repeat protein